MPSLDDILSAYKDCGITYAQAELLLTRPPPTGIGLPTQTARDYLNSTGGRNCGDGINTTDPYGTGISGSLPTGTFDIPDNLFGFFMLLAGLR